MSNNKHSLSILPRIYIHGCVAMAVIFAVAYVAWRLLPFFAFLQSTTLSLVTAVIVIVVLPPVFGCILLFGILPLLGKTQAWRGLDSWDNRLYAEVSRAKESTRIVIVDWPSPSIRTMGIQTSTFEAGGDGKQMATVYVPIAPQSQTGYVRIVAVEDLEYTDWTLEQWQLYQLSFGAVNPARLSRSNEAS